MVAYGSTLPQVHCANWHFSLPHKEKPILSELPHNVANHGREYFFPMHKFDKV